MPPLLAHVLGLFVPAVCVGCGASALPDPRAALCPGCAARLPWLGGACPRCAGPCGGRCPATAAAFDAAYAPMALTGPARALVHALKFDRATRLADAMAAQMLVALPAWAVTPGDRALVPVPADPWRRRRRGTDHARSLASALAERTGLPLADVLRRRPGAGRQVGAGRCARRAALASAVVVRGRPPACAVVVDDVHTTGATLDACARALRREGVRQIVGITYAKTLRM